MFQPDEYFKANLIIEGNHVFHHEGEWYYYDTVYENLSGPFESEDEAYKDWGVKVPKSDDYHLTWAQK